MQVKCGTYTGNNTDNRTVTGIGFQPDLVIAGGFVTVPGLMSGVNTHFRVASMGTNQSISIRGDSSAVTDAIKSLDSDGFTLGTSEKVNANTVSYHYIAIRDNGAGDFKQGTYTGNGSDGLAITGLGFQPNYLTIKSNSGIVGASKYATQSGLNAAMQFDGTDRSDLIQIDSDGFTVNNGSGSGANLVNVNATAHYYFAFKEVSGFCVQFDYTGNATDNRDITTPGFEPGVVFLKGNTGNNAIFRTSSYSGDNTQRYSDEMVTNRIQGFISTGFQIGTDGEVNTNTSTYRALALKEGTSSTAYDITADAGTFTLTGQTSDLNQNIVIVNEVGSFSLTGQDADLQAQYIVDTEVGSFLLTGQDAALTFQSIMSGEVGAFTLTGNDAALPVSYQIDTERGTFTLTGRSAGLDFSSSSGAGIIFIGIAI